MGVKHLPIGETHSKKLIENAGLIYILFIDRQKLFVFCEEDVVEGGCRGGRMSWREDVVEGGCRGGRMSWRDVVEGCRGGRMFLTHLTLNVVCGPDRCLT
jgi:hypothetical protein